ncbi:MAG: DUF799 family lipoprotein [Candidatus Alcyoniella australis]|nr:DUF799 family lipoprotein [Candidatus Alcyoniella australis]
MRVLNYGRAAVLLLIMLCALALIACSSAQKHYTSPDFDPFRMLSVAVLPPFNATADMDAPEAFRPIVEQELRDRGYNVLSSGTVDQLMQDEGMYVAEDLHLLDMQDLYEIFGTDAVLFTTVTVWKKTFLVQYASITVGARFELVEVPSGEVIWWWDDRVVDLRVGVDRETTAQTWIFALSPYEPYVRQVSQRAFSTLP